MYFISPRLQKGLFFPRTLPFSPSGTYFPVRRRVEDDNFLRKYCHTKSQENVPGMAHRIGVPATTSHASEEEKGLEAGIVDVLELRDRMNREEGINSSGSDGVLD